eukprot:CAMPEP_0180681436 /NCGR_PEP_ID=MMETSP1037_2-20121125/69998_1 /TAXON_ID=632150 /ORGANISM="Azadinium spinosum, Strain 3D9" /LENGTH=90 /DNA_ID=CAMNT_0022711313 /DNA_START=222 /DNA_END=490 /DNA_ORIENTATION=-
MKPETTTQLRHDCEQLDWIHVLEIIGNTEFQDYSWATAFSLTCFSCNNLTCLAPWSCSQRGRPSVPPRPTFPASWCASVAVAATTATTAT